MAEKEKYANQIYDERKWNSELGEYDGYELKAGDIIRYWPPQTLANHQEMITTKITFIGDLYYTKMMAGNVPINVEQSGNPPFWETEIEKLPFDADNPKLVKLKYCKLVPSEADDEILKEQKKIRKNFEESMNKDGWGSALYKEKKKSVAVAQNKNKKRKISKIDTQISSGTDSDVQILENKKKDKQKSVKIPGIVNEEKSVKMTFHKTKKSKKRKPSVDNVPEPVKKKRRLNNPKNDKLVVESVAEPKASKPKRSKPKLDESEKDYLPSFAPKNSPKQKRKRARAEPETSPLSSPKKKKQKQSKPKKQTKVRKVKKDEGHEAKKEDSALSDISNTPPKQQKSKRKLLPTKPSNDQNIMS